MNRKKITFTVLVIFCISIIFMFSQQNGNRSENVSDVFSIKIIDCYARLTKREFKDSEKERIVKDIRTIVRKGAHFTVYLLLGLFSYCMFKCYGIEKCILFALLFCVCYACFDEIHQLFVNARTGRLFDVFVDTSGASVGICLAIFLNFLRKKILKIS